MMLGGSALLWGGSSGVPKRLGVFGRAEAASAMAQTMPTIAVIVKDTTSLYWQTVLAGARKAGQELGVRIAELGTVSESDVAGQISILETALASNAAAVVVAPADFVALGIPIDEAAGKLKVIGIDSAADSTALTSMLATDNVQAGRIAADILAERIQKTYADAEGDVALISFLPATAALDQRGRGFREQIAAKYGALDIVAEKVADGQASTVRKIMAELIDAHPELRGVFTSNLLLTRGAAEVVAGYKTNKTGDKINLVGFDWDEQLVKLVEDSTIAALVVQDPYRMGYESVRTALAALKGERVPTNIDTGVGVITKANMDSARSQELLNPKIK
jgi:ribose transport system substrate-binding protein